MGCNVKCQDSAFRGAGGLWQVKRRVIAGERACKRPCSTRRASAAAAASSCDRRVEGVEGVGWGG